MAAFFTTLPSPGVPSRTFFFLSEFYTNRRVGPEGWHLSLLLGSILL